MFTFAWPWMILLLPLPWLAWRFWPVTMRPDEAAPEIRFPHAERLKSAFPTRASTGKPPSRRLYYTLLALAWLGLTASLMQPQTINSFTNVRNEGHDLMLLVDLSGSMQALDLSQGFTRESRVDVVKKVVGQFVQERQGDRIGLVLFGEHAYLDSPLTEDTLAVGQMLDKAEAGEAGDSTAIGDAIGIAVQNLRNRPGKDKAIILLTDGGDNASSIPPMQAAKLAAQYGIRIYTVGVGSNGPVPIPDDSGNIVMAEFDLDENLLRDIAASTGGQYFRATDQGALQGIYNQINMLEKSEAESHSYMIRTPLFRYPLSAAMAMIALLGLLPLARRRHAV
jgi:Ca-activated chloride channel family protein